MNVGDRLDECESSDDAASSDSEAPLASEHNLTPEDMEVDEEEDDSAKSDDEAASIAAGDASTPTTTQLCDSQSSSCDETEVETNTVESQEVSSDASKDTTNTASAGSDDSEAECDQNRDEQKTRDTTATVAATSDSVTSAVSRSNVDVPQTLALESRACNVTGNNNSDDDAECKPHCDTPIPSPSDNSTLAAVDENLQQYSSFLYWREPLPDVTDESDILISLNRSSSQAAGESSSVMTLNDNLLNSNQPGPSTSTFNNNSYTDNDASALAQSLQSTKIPQIYFDYRRISIRLQHLSLFCS